MNGDRIRIGVDVMGAENGVEAVLNAVSKVLEMRHDIDFVLYGTKDDIVKILSESERVTIIQSGENIPMDVVSPVRACLKYDDSSTRLALNDLKTKKTHAIVSNVNTGALVAGAANAKILGMLTDKNSVALTATLPQKDGSNALFLDVGADKNGTDPDKSLQNAIMAVKYVQDVWGIEKPIIAYGNIGTEEGKGKDVDKQSLKRIRDYFGDKVDIKNTEPNTYLNSGAHIILTSGVRGNMKLKMGEGTFQEVATAIKQSLLNNSGNLWKKFRGKLGALLVGDLLKEALLKYDPRERGGAICLGVDGIVIKSHGGEDERGITSAILQAIEYATAEKRYNILRETKAALEELKKTED